MSLHSVPASPVRKKKPVWLWFAIGNVLVLVLAGVGTWAYLRNLGQRSPTEPPPLHAATANTEVAAPATKMTAPPPPHAEKPQPPSPPQPKPLSVAEVVERVDHGVVLVSCKNAKGTEIALGSGFVIDPAGLIASNYHVFRKASKADATFVDGKKVEVKGCRAWDADRDLIILELAQVPQGLKVVQLSPTVERKQAADVIAIGHPQGFKFTTTTGIISAVHQTAELPKPYREFIHAPPECTWLQTNAAISGGSSGGPLLDREGQVIGITTWIADGQNLGFAIDIRHLIALRAKTEPKATPLADLTGPEERLDELIGEFNNQYGYFQQEVEKTWTKAAAQKLIDTRHPALDYLPKFYEFATKHRHTPIALHSLAAISHVAGKIHDCPPACNPTLKLAGDRIVEDYKSDRRIVSTLMALVGTSLDEGRSILRRVGQESKDRQVQGTALFLLAISLSREADPKQKRGEKPEEQQKRSDEAVALLERVTKDFSDVEVLQQELGKIAEPMLFELKHLAIGRVAPDIVGREIDGKEFKLSDYRGKVVVLDFWVDWCPYCVQMYPLERDLTKRYEGKPFALLGVNCDEPGRLRRVLDAKTVTWRNWSDGPQGPIAQKWRVKSYPTLFVLDPQGVIRHKQLRGRELEQAVAELMSKPPESKPEKPEAALAKTEKPKDDAPAKRAPAKPEFRTWKRKDGRTAEFRFVAVEGNKVRVERADGRNFTLNLDDLSEEDQKWAREHAKK